MRCARRRARHRRQAPCEGSWTSWAATQEDDWLTREDLLAEMERGRDCTAERRRLAEALRSPHYRRVVRRIEQAHDLRRYRHNTKRFYNGYLVHSLYAFRDATDGAAGDLRALRPPSAATRARKRYLRSLRMLNRTAARMQQREEHPFAVLGLLERLPAQARAADRAHAALLRAALRPGG